MKMRTILLRKTSLDRTVYLVRQGAKYTIETFKGLQLVNITYHSKVKGALAHYNQLSGGCK